MASAAASAAMASATSTAAMAISSSSTSTSVSSPSVAASSRNSNSSSGSSSGSGSGSSAKKLVFTRIKDLSPLLCDKDVHVKAIVMENNAKDENNTGNNATLLIGDETGCASLVIRKNIAYHVRVGDILQLASVQVVMKNSHIYLWGGKVERIGEFTLAFKELFNVSQLTWVKDPSNPDVMIPSRNSAKRPKQVKT